MCVCIYVYWGWYGTVQIFLSVMHIICVQHLELCQVRKMHFINK